MTGPKRRFQVKKIDERRFKLDVKGLACPYPQLLAVRSLNSLASGEVLEVIVDNPPSVKEIPTVLEEKGYKVTTSRLDSSTWKIAVQR